VVHAGRVPSPAIALYGLEQRIPTVMVTGSHIPDDRNGIKFNTADGEVLKKDEAGICEQVVEIPDRIEPCALGAVETTAARSYVRRYLSAFPSDLLRGKRIGLYEHSAVGRDLLFEIFSGLGADVTRFGRSDAFVAVDTEAIRPEDTVLVAKMAAEHGFDAQVSTDGDSDRPLLADEKGRLLRGDVAGILCARYLGADVVVTPVSSNTAVEKCGAFVRVVRTRIGSPFVIDEMQRAVDGGAKRVVGYEANGGFLTASPIPAKAGTLAPLPTRDPLIVQIAILAMSAASARPISALLADLPARTTASGVLRAFPTERSRAKIAELAAGGAEAIARAFAGRFGKVVSSSEIDGLRITFEGDRVVHLRPSGNAPELRCYTEAATDEDARSINATAIEAMGGWR
jgi:phosphomannomutase